MEVKQQARFLVKDLSSLVTFCIVAADRPQVSATGLLHSVSYRAPLTNTFAEWPCPVEKKAAHWESTVNTVVTLDVAVLMGKGPKRRGCPYQFRLAEMRTTYLVLHLFRRYVYRFGTTRTRERAIQFRAQTMSLRTTVGGALNHLLNAWRAKRRPVSYHIDAFDIPLLLSGDCAH